jgi:hypothetical protein
MTIGSVGLDFSPADGRWSLSLIDKETVPFCPIFIRGFAQ